MHHRDSRSPAIALLLTAVLASGLFSACATQRVQSDWYQKGDAAYEQSDYKEAFAWYRKAAEAGHVEAQTQLGMMYATGQGVRQDYDAALAWTRKAAESGHVRAQTNLGILYMTGFGIPRDFKESVKWLTMGAEGGDPKAQTQLGLMRETGIGIARDPIRALHWYRKAATSTEEPYATLARNGLERLEGEDSLKD
ncbi:putative Beta-lactamase [Nitrospina gracilis 3/211]|uniref:Putative Beta-lactamase n=1 Tax=Nitrospina gracilis (strain 3/211) TaxID=1266370 RepID=M1YN56_NITG3|nr:MULTISPECIES: tetratricopeptide repeat protein [Nitrospina]MCF8722506.1 TPR repeat protein [Nitrospina sp. Nb-3]CCQ91937.1 putative Beta-lactamase [Nitrospina gracilis 3/211]